MSAANSMARGSTCSEAEALFSACRPPMGHLLECIRKRAMDSFLEVPLDHFVFYIFIFLEENF